MPIWREASACGSICTCTAYFWAPSTCTCATPEIIETRCARRVSAYSSRVQSGSVGEVRARYRIGWSAGFTLVKVGGVGMPCGSTREACVMAACTSTAAPSSLRFRSNSSVICVLPSEFEDVIEFKPAMVENWFSSGVATADAMVSGLAPGRLAVTSRVGKSTLGRSLTARDRYATPPNSAMAAISRLVAIGRSINVWEIFMRQQRRNAFRLILRTPFPSAPPFAGAFAAGRDRAWRCTGAPPAAYAACAAAADRHLAARRQPQLAFLHYGLARFQTLLNHHVLVDSRAGRHRAVLHAAVRLHHVNVRTVLSGHHCLIRNRHGVRRRSQQ